MLSITNPLKSSIAYVYIHSLVQMSFRVFLFVGVSTGRMVINVSLLCFFLMRSGYMAPEYVMQGFLSVKADVFSFGVVVLELISGQKNSSFSLRHPDLTLLEWVSV